MKKVGTALLSFLALLACQDTDAPTAVDAGPAAPSYQVLASSVTIENKAHTNSEDDDPSLTYDHPEAANYLVVFASAFDREESAQISVTYGGVPLDSVDLSGVAAEDFGRNGPFWNDPADWPDEGPYDPPVRTQHYNWTGLRGSAPGIVILQREGYAAIDWGDQALRRHMEANWRFSQLYGDRGWYWATDTGNEWLPPLINYLYDETFLNEPQRFSYFGGSGEAVGFTQWTHAGRTVGGG